MPPPDQPSMLDSVTQSIRNGQALRQEEQRRLREDQSRVVGQTAAQMVASGQCDNAQKYAAANGEFKLATDIANYCATQGK